MAAALMEELLEEVLVRFPPDDPASLVRAALISKPWCRLICGRGFRRRFREFHGTPPLLGFFCQRGSIQRQPFFIPSSSFRPRDRDLADDPRYMTPIHSCHGRVLLHSGSTSCLNSYRMIWEDLFVWDPITNELRSLPRWPLYSLQSCRLSNAAVACADAVVGDGCNHLDCHHGHFMVVFVGIDDYEQTFTCVYSSQDGWSEPIWAAQRYHGFEMGNVVLVRNALHFKCRIGYGHAILKFDLLTREASPIHIPRDGILKHIDYQHTGLTAMEVLKYIDDQHIVLTAVEDSSRLGFAFTMSLFTKPTLYLFSRENDSPDEDAGWAQSRVMDLRMLLKAELYNVVAKSSDEDARRAQSRVKDLRMRLKAGLYNVAAKSPDEYARRAQSRAKVEDLRMLLKAEMHYVASFADTGAGGVIFIWTALGFFSVDLKSSSTKMVGRSYTSCMVPYTSFCTPVIRAVSIDEAPGGGEPTA